MTGRSQRYIIQQPLTGVISVTRGWSWVWETLNWRRLNSPVTLSSTTAAKSSLRMERRHSAILTQCKENVSAEREYSHRSASCSISDFSSVGVEAGESGRDFRRTLRSRSSDSRDSMTTTSLFSIACTHARRKDQMETTQTLATLSSGKLTSITHITGGHTL